MKILLSPKFKIQKSYGLCLIFLFVHTGSIFCICFINLIFPAKAVLIICVLVNLIAVIRNYALRNSHQAIIEFWRNNDGDWYLKTKSEDVLSAFLNFPVFVSNYLVVLNFVSTKNSSKITLLITKDTFLVKDDFRKLKMLLR